MTIINSIPNIMHLKKKSHQTINFTNNNNDLYISTNSKYLSYISNNALNLHGLDVFIFSQYWK